MALRTNLRKQVMVDSIYFFVDVVVWALAISRQLLVWRLAVRAKAASKHNLYIRII